MGNYQKKSYKLFVVWMLCYIVGLNGIPIILGENFVEPKALIRVILMVTYTFLLALLFLIYKTESIYWFNGTSYEEASKVTSEARKAFAIKHLKRFGVGAGIFLVYTLIGLIFKLDEIGDIWVFIVTICVSAFSTIKIKL